MTRVAFISPSGFGNLGDAAIVDSLIAGIRSRFPDSEIVGFTLNPSDTEQRHKVEAFTCGAYSLPHYPMRPQSRESGRNTGAHDQPERRGFTRFVHRVIASIPGARAAWRAATRLRADHKYGRDIATRVRGFDHIVIAGGGQFDDLWGGAFGHPYTLFRWSRTARRAGARFSALSVGTGSLVGATSRAFIARTLANASYRSFRDVRSRELAAAPPTELIVPDLAYALPIDPPPHSLIGSAAHPGRAGVIDHDRGFVGGSLRVVGMRPIIGVAPMCYADPRVWPRPDAARYAHHIATLAQVAANAARAGNDVVIFATDRPDRSPVAECHAQAIAALDSDLRSRVRVSMPDQLPELMDLLASVDVVVAARFHGVLLAHVAGTPAIGVAHERKVRTLLNEMGQDAYCEPIDELDPIVVGGHIAELLTNREPIRAHIQSVVAAYRCRVEAQYDRVFGQMPASLSEPEDHAPVLAAL